MGDGMETNVNQKDRLIIGLAGFIGSGKDTVADILVKQGFRKISFADAVKDGVSSVFKWDRELLEGSTKESRKWRETIDPFWTNELGFDVTPRYVLQRFGTDCMRYGFHQDVWMSIVKKEIFENADTNFVIPDVRFQNERNMFREIKGQVWRIKRGKDPEWTEKAISDNKYDTSWMAEQHPDIHESEWRWLDHNTEYDRVILNDSSLDELIIDVKKYM